MEPLCKEKRICKERDSMEYVQTEDMHNDYMFGLYEAKPQLHLRVYIAG